MVLRTQVRLVLHSSAGEGEDFKSALCRLGSQAAVMPLPPPMQTLLPSLSHTDKRAFFIICTSELGPPQIYELVALTSSDKNT